MKRGLLLLLLAGPAWAKRDIAVRRIGPMIDASGNNAHIVGQDGAYSISLGKSSLWVYGDTFYGRRKPDGTPDIEGAVFNSAALTADPDASDGITGLAPLVDDKDNPRAILALDSNEDPKKTRLWPGAGLKIGGKIYLYYSLVEVYGSGNWDFRHSGQGLAVGENPHKPFTRLISKGRYAFWTRSQPRFGIAVVDDKDGWLYVFGRDEAKPNSLRLARVRPGAIDDTNAYQYFATSPPAQWTTELSSAASLFHDAPPETSVSYNRYLGQYLMLYSRFLEKDVVVRTAPHPWGPWARPRPIYRCQPSKPDAYCYAAKEHPEYASEGGKRIYFTVVDSGEAMGGMPELFEATFRPAEPIAKEPERKRAP
jgi:hypothetical protein